MSSSVKDILLEGSTCSTDMKLNDFLRSKLGGRGVVDTNEKVAMEMFVQDPETFIQNERLLRIITASPSYQELERELDEMKILLEAINKLHDEDVFSLEQWRGYEGKDTVTPLARGKINGVLTHVLREERRWAEERAVREKQVELTLTTTIEDVLFRGRVRVKDMKLNDFITMEMEGRGILRANRNVLLKEFFKDPTRYIHDAGVLNEIQASDAYLMAERAVRDEMDMEKDLRKLYKNGVSNLFGWSVASAEIRASVRDITKSFLDAALEEARKPTTTIAPIKMEGLYESVYNARWHHVVEVPGGEGTGMEVKKGRPPQQWTYKKVGYCLERDDGAEQYGAARLRLMVLASDKGRAVLVGGD
ncbi:putative retrotransposon hot spot (RHS) protein [Trypanosoma cruzi]|uniref:Putative retrotransposon hot spot (RHS) protein n=1 Tax=Trypanosoma cruzi TaxID=5693 RepID=A0A2V2W2T4_TRYCR|nr:putative retrotransposon hot spot (RHS) protein [Trypanosoma cruzi]RNC40832.1 retrotransposon hot spot (RHS) protein [Trypanosoma cruzi]